MLWLDFNLLTSGNRFADLWIEFIYSATAACLHIIMLIPFKTRNKEKRQDSIGHEYVVSAITPTDIADDGLSEIQVFSAVCNSHHEKHVLFNLLLKSSYTHHSLHHHPYISRCCKCMQA